MTSLAEKRDFCGKRALVADDEETVGQIMCLVLERMGYHVDHVKDGQAALEAGLQHDYDVVLCDLLMPGVSGMSIYQTWLAEKPAMATRVIFVTGDSMGLETNDFLARTGQPCIHKPFRLAELADLITALGEN